MIRRAFAIFLHVSLFALLLAAAANAQGTEEDAAPPAQTAAADMATDAAAPSDHTAEEHAKVQEHAASEAHAPAEPHHATEHAAPHGTVAPSGHDAHAASADHGEDDHGEGAAHGPNWRTIFWKGFNFAVLLLVLGKLLAAPIRGFFVGRKADIAERLRAAEEARDQALAKLAELESRLQAADRESSEMLARAVTEAAAEREHILRAAREEADRARALAQDEMRVATETAKAELRAYAAELATARAAEIVAAQIQDGDRKRLFEEYLTTIGKVVPREGGR